jgi:hypothetical protein
MGTEIGNWIPAGVVIALIGGAFAVWQARVGIRPAERAGFREDFQALVAELRRTNDGLKAQNAAQAGKIDALEAKVDELTLETRALGGYTRVLIRELRDRGLAVPTYQPPPDLTKHLIP